MTLLHPCKKTLLTTTQTIADISYTYPVSPLVKPFSAFADSVGVAYSNPTLCGLTYSLSDPTDASNFGVSLNGFNIEVSSVDITRIGQQITLQLRVDAVPQQDTPSDVVNFNVIMVSPCNDAILTLPTTLTNVSIVAGSGTHQFNAFAPATSDVETRLNSPGGCLDRVYSIVEVVPASIVTITAPGGNPYADNWTLDCFATTIP